MARMGMHLPWMCAEHVGHLMCGRIELVVDVTVVDASVSRQKT